MSEIHRQDQAALEVLFVGFIIGLAYFGGALRPDDELLSSLDETFA